MAIKNGWQSFTLHLKGAVVKRLPLFQTEFCRHMWIYGNFHLDGWLTIVLQPETLVTWQCPSTPGVVCTAQWPIPHPPPPPPPTGERMPPARLWCSTIEGVTLVLLEPYKYKLENLFSQVSNKKEIKIMICGRFSSEETFKFLFFISNIFLLLTLNIGIQIKQKELTEIFMMISNWKNPLVSMVCIQIFKG